MTWVKSFVDDLNEDRGIVSRRATSLLRSAEINPQIHDLFGRRLGFWYRRTFLARLTGRARQCRRPRTLLASERDDEGKTMRGSRRVAYDSEASCIKSEEEREFLVFGEMCAGALKYKVRRYIIRRPDVIVTQIVWDTDRHGSSDCTKV